MKTMTIAEILAMPRPQEPSVIIDWETKTIDIYGGNSGYIKDDPYWIGFDCVDQTDWLFHMAEKNWSTAIMIARLEKAIRTVKESRISGSSHG